MSIYSAVFAGVAVTAQQDLFELNAPATGVVRLCEIHLSQSTEVGDAMEEGLSILLKTGATTSGTGGTTPTASPYHPTDQTFAGTVEVNNTTKATTGTILTHAAWNWNVRVPLDIYFPPGYQKVVAPSGRLTVELATTPADSITMSGYIVFEFEG